MASKDFKNVKIYSIRNTEDDDIYVGSTTQPLSKRMSKHRCDVKGYKQNRKLYAKMNELGIDSFYIELIEEYPCDNVEQLRKREGHFIRLMGTLNSLVAGQTDKEYKENSKERLSEAKKIYYQRHKEQLNAYHKEWYKENKEAQAEKNKVYREQNKDEIRQRKKEYHAKHKSEIQTKAREYYTAKRESVLEAVKQYRDNNKEVIRERKSVAMTCECGSCFRKNDKAKHERTQKHQNWLQQQNTNH